MPNLAVVKDNSTPTWKDKTARGHTVHQVKAGRAPGLRCSGPGCLKRSVLLFGGMPTLVAWNLGMVVPDKTSQNGGHCILNCLGPSHCDL